MKEAGGVMTEEDLASYHSKIEEPLSVPYRGYTVYKTGFWNQGPALLQSLRILEGFDLRSMGQGSADALHTTVEAIKLAYADRDRYYGDPNFVRVPGDALLSEPYAVARRALIDPRHASLEARPGDPLNARALTQDLRTRDEGLGRKDVAPKEVGDTTSVQVADAAGNLFSATPSSGWLLGGAFVAGRSGVPMSNRMGRFDELRSAAPLLFDGTLQPVIDIVLPLAEAADAQRRLENRGQFGKIVLQV